MCGLRTCRRSRGRPSGSCFSRWHPLPSQRTGIINQIRAFLLERSIAVRQGIRFLRAELPRILAMPPDVLSPRMVRIVEDLACDWRRLDERVEGLSNEIETIARQDAGCERLMSVPGIGTIISSAMVAAIGAGDVFTKGRDFAAWLGLVPKQISTGDRTILGKVSRRGNRYLRVLFVQAAWVVLIKPKIWERHGLKPWLEAASYTDRLDAAPRSSDCRSRSICFWKFAGNSRSSSNDARSRSPISLTISRLWRESISTRFRIAGSPMNPEGRWFQTETNGGPSPLDIARACFLEQCS